MVPCFLSSISPCWLSQLPCRPKDLPETNRGGSNVVRQRGPDGDRLHALLVPKEWRRPGPQSCCRSSIAEQQHECECSRKCVNKCYWHERPLRVQNVMCDAVTGRRADKGGDQAGNQAQRPELGQPRRADLPPRRAEGLQDHRFP